MIEMPDLSSNARGSFENPSIPRGCLVPLKDCLTAIRVSRASPMKFGRSMERCVARMAKEQRQTFSILTIPERRSIRWNSVRNRCLVSAATRIPE